MTQVQETDTKQWRPEWSRKRDRKDQPLNVAHTLATQELAAADELVQAGYSPDAFVHTPTRARVLSRIDLASYGAQATGQWSAMIQAEVKIGEHLGMWSQQGRSDEVTLALVDALRQAVVGNATPKPLPSPVIEVRAREGSDTQPAPIAPNQP